MPFNSHDYQVSAANANRKAWLPAAVQSSSAPDDGGENGGTGNGANSKSLMEARASQRHTSKLRNAQHEKTTTRVSQPRRSSGASGRGEQIGREKSIGRPAEFASDIFQGAKERLISSSSSNNNNNSSSIMTKQHQESSSNEPLQGGGRGRRKLRSHDDDGDGDDDDDSRDIIGDVSEKGRSFRFARWMRITSAIIMLNLLILFWPIQGPNIAPKLSPIRPRPKFQGPLKVNEELDLRGELLFAGQFHAPESFAWRKDKRSFYTGVEGGFILMVEPYEERWTVVAKLNSRSVLDKSSNSTSTQKANNNNNSNNNNDDDNNYNFVPFCDKDVKLYGRRAEFEPKLVVLSRCSRPLGIRLSPNDSYLYVSDPLSGLFRIDLINENTNRAQVSKMVDFSEFQRGQEIGREPGAQGSENEVIFADDIAVDWGAGSEGSDLIYLTDCSMKWTIRYLFRLMFDNDDTGRVMEFDVGQRQLRPLRASLRPVRISNKRDQVKNKNLDLIRPGDDSSLEQAETTTTNGQEVELDYRNLSFPNGLELSANGSALLISDLNNRRILMHHLRGPLAGQTEHLLWVPGYSDNIRRGLDLEDGRPSYWTACGCAVDDGVFEPEEFFNDYPNLKKLVLKWLNFFGILTERLGSLLNSTSLIDAGFMIKAGWLKTDPYCAHGIVLQFDERGQIIQSLQGLSFGSNFRLLSEAHQVPLLADISLEDVAGRHHLLHQQPAAGNQSILYLGSVYYSYLGRIKLFGQNGSAD